VHITSAIKNLIAAINAIKNNRFTALFSAGQLVLEKFIWLF